MNAILARLLQPSSFAGLALVAAGIQQLVQGGATAAWAMLFGGLAAIFRSDGSDTAVKAIEVQNLVQTAASAVIADHKDAVRAMIRSSATDIIEQQAATMATLVEGQVNDLFDKAIGAPSSGQLQNPAR